VKDSTITKTGKQPADRLPNGRFAPGHEPMGGRPKGAKDKITKTIVEQILAALEARGGQEYLQGLPDHLFVHLVGRVIPRKVDLDAQVSFEDELRQIEEAGAELAGLDPGSDRSSACER